MRLTHSLATLLAAAAVVAVAGCGAGGVAGDNHDASPGSGTSPATDSTGPDSTGPAGTSPAGDGGDAGETSSIGDADETTADTADPAATGTDTGPAPTGHDALTLTGSTDTRDVPDMVPVLTDPQPQLPATVTDSAGREITVERADRVIALDLYGTLSDTIIGLGLADRLVGRGASDTQEILADLPVVSMGGIGLSPEAVLGLHPDVVLTNITIGSEEIYAQLEAAGVTVVRFDTVPSLAELADSMTEVAAVFGMADAAQELIDHTLAELERSRETIAALKAATPRPPRTLVLYVRGTAGMFFIFGAGYGVSDILHELGLEDTATEHGIEKLVPANPESLATLDPEIILTMRAGLETGGGVPALLQRPGISATTAGQHDRIITANDAQLLSYGPRTPAVLVALAEAIYDPAG